MESSSYRLRMIWSYSPRGRRVLFGRAKALSLRTIILWVVVFSASATILRWVFGVQRRSVARYEAHVAKLDNRSGFIDLFWPGVLLVEQKSAGRDLRKAYEQAGEYFDALPERGRPRFILVSDFRTFELHDLDERETVTFPLTDLPAHVEAFGFVLGVQRRTFRDQDPANIEAAELVGRLHDALADAGHRQPP